ncbi:MAG: hypothetical protein HY901_00405 [Deltaproteobacteria bacterium]|nr:hypothetical protein [Deltaproteobacteria bacterium]
MSARTNPSWPLAALLVVAMLVACLESPSPVDAGGVGNPDTSTAAGDAGASPGPDAAQADGGASGPRDAAVFMVDGSVSGTPLENVAVQWPGPIDLCTRWRENNELAQEVARKVHVAIPQQVRLGLQPWQLAQARVDGLLVEKGNLSSQRWRPSEDSIGLSLRHYEVSTTGDYTSLQASIAHDLGAAGVLVERYQLYRSAQHTEPVVIGGGEDQVGFHLEMLGVPEPIELEACQGEPDWEKAVEVLRATRAGRHLVIHRYMDTRQLVRRGTYAVRLRGVQVAFTDAAWAVIESGDFFAQTYAAQHHNWFEDSLIDFTQEPRLYHTVFRPISEGGAGIPATPERLALNDVQGLDTLSYIDLTTRNPDGDATTERWDVQGGWTRVDDTVMTRRLTCDDASTFLVGLSGNGYMDSFQLLTCPQAAAPGYSLEGVVPVWFAEDPAVIGTLIEKAAISPASSSGRAGHSVKVGAFTVTFSTSNGTSFFVDVRDAQGQSTASYLSDKGELGPYPEPRHETLTAQSGAGDVSMMLERQRAGQGDGMSTIYVPLSFSMTFGGRTYVVDAMDRLRYTNTHHNWEDALEAKTGDGLVLLWRTRFLDEIHHEVEVKRESGEQVLAPTVLE